MKTADLQGAALDWAVAKAQGLAEILVFGRTRPTDRGWVEVRFNPEPKARTARFDPSVNWSLGGPLIESAGIRTHRSHTGQWWASPESDPGRPVEGPTLLVAGLRAYVLDVLGPEVDVPGALILWP